jgi:hypothetical protein
MRPRAALLLFALLSPSCVVGTDEPVKHGRESGHSLDDGADGSEHDAPPGTFGATWAVSKGIIYLCVVATDGLGASVCLSSESAILSLAGASAPGAALGVLLRRQCWRNVCGRRD